MTDHKERLPVWKKRERRAAWACASDIYRHEMEVVRDDGVHRHLRFRQPDTGQYWFDLVTWPGTLCIDGDMGTFVFHRVTDMFTFFRHDRTNPDYWAQKLANPLSRKGVKEYSEDSFRESVEEWRDGCIEWMDREQHEYFRVAVDDEILRYGDDGHHKAVEAWCDFTFGNIDAHDCYEYDVTEYDYGFLWSLWAIVLGIKMYDKAAVHV